jgi:hypothetical protein
VADVVKEASDVRIDYPVHFPLRDSYVERIQGPVLAPSRTKTVTETQEVLFVDAFQNRARRLWDNFVFPSGDAQRAKLAIRFRDVSPLRGLSPVRTAMDSSVQIVDPPFHIHLVIMPRLAIDSRRGVLLQIEETRLQQFRREMVQQ